MSEPSILQVIVERLYFAAANVDGSVSLDIDKPFVALFVYAGRHAVPPDIDADAQIMMSSDKNRWIVFSDDNAPCGSCTWPLVECDPRETPFCHRAYSRTDLDFSVRMAQTEAAVHLAFELAPADVPLTVFIVNYDASAQDANMNIQVMDRYAIQPKQRADSENEPAPWMLVLLGGGVVLLIVGLVALFCVRRNPNENVSAAASPAPTMPAKTTMAARIRQLPKRSTVASRGVANV